MHFCIGMRAGPPARINWLPPEARMKRPLINDYRLRRANPGPSSGRAASTTWCCGWRTWSRSAPFTATYWLRGRRSGSPNWACCTARGFRADRSGYAGRPIGAKAVRSAREAVI